MYKRAVGFCSQPECDDFEKGTFLLNYGTEYYCARCRFRGWIAAERQVDHAPTDAVEPVYKTVKVHFNYEAKDRRYTNIAVVSVPELDSGFLFEIYSPLIKTDKRALALGESTICALNSGDRSGVLSEVQLRFDESWDEQIKKLERVLENRDRRVYARKK